MGSNLFHQKDLTNLSTLSLLLALLIPKFYFSYSLGGYSSAGAIQRSQASVLDQQNSKIYLGSQTPQKIYEYDIPSGNWAEINYLFTESISKIKTYKNTGKLLVSTRTGGHLFNPATASIEHTFLADERVDLLDFYSEVGIFIYDKFEWNTNKPRPNLYRVFENDLSNVAELNGETAGLTFYIRRVFLRKYCPYLYIAGDNLEIQLVDHSQMQLTTLKISSGGTQKLRWLMQGPRILSIIISREFGDIEYIQDIDGVLLKRIQTGYNRNLKYLELAPNSQILLGTVWEDKLFFMYNLKTSSALFTPLLTDNSRSEFFITDWVNLKLYVPMEFDLRIYDQFAVSCSTYGEDLKTCSSCDSKCSSCFGPGPEECNLCSGGKLLQDTDCVSSCTYNSFENFGLEKICYPVYFPSSDPPPETESKPGPVPDTTPQNQGGLDCKKRNLLNENGKCVEKCSNSFYKEDIFCKEISSIKENMGLDISNNYSLRRCSLWDCNNCKPDYLQCLDNKNVKFNDIIKKIGRISQSLLALAILITTGVLPQIIKILFNLLQVLQKFLFVQRDLGLAEPILLAFGEGGMAFDQLTRLIIRLTEDFKPDPLVERSGFSTLLLNNLGPILLTTFPMIVMAIVSIIFFWKKKKEFDLKVNKVATETHSNLNKFEKSLKASLDERISDEMINGKDILNKEAKRVPKDDQDDYKKIEKSHLKTLVNEKKSKFKFLKIYFREVIKEFKPAKLLEIFSGMVFELTMSCMIHIFAIPQNEKIKKDYQIYIISGLIASYILLTVLVAIFIFIWFSNAKWIAEIRDNSIGEDSKISGYFSRRYFVLWMVREAAAAVFLFLLAKNCFWQIIVLSILYLAPLFFFKFHILKDLKSSLNMKFLELLQGLAFLILIFPYKFSNFLFLILLFFLVIFAIWEIIYELVTFVKNFGKQKNEEVKKIGINKEIFEADIELSTIKDKSSKVNFM